MEEPIPNQPTEPATELPLGKQKKHLPEVLTVRDWKEYIGESLLIVFSVLLALVLTEYFNSLHEKQQVKEVVKQLKEELIKNKQSEEAQYAYHLQVLKNIDTALNNPAVAQKFINNGAINLNVIAPQGVISADLNDVAWQIAKQNNIVARIDLDTYSILTNIYANQLKITNAEGEIGRVLLSWESRRPENLRTTLLLIRDNYHGWAVDRAPALLKLYQQAIDKLEAY